jgi:CBS domain containing-hemolysin-like protein
VTALLTTVAFVLIVSGFCSLSEASIYAVRRPYIRQLVEGGKRAGPVLDAFKGNMERPITAILVVNTLANTAGASYAGAQAAQLMGSSALIWFSAAFTMGVLFLSEIAPKVIGVTHNRSVASAVALPWNAMIRLMYPITASVESLSRMLKPDQPGAAAPEDEVAQLARLSAEEGSILPLEMEIVHNALKLNEITARDIMTPRIKVFRLPSDMTVQEVLRAKDRWSLSRIPVFDPADPERWTGVVRAVDILRALAEDQFETTVGQLAQPLHFVPEGTEGHILLELFLEKRSHLFGVVDEFGGLSGVATLEDVLESLIGSEIVDEVDTEVDSRAHARQQYHSVQVEREGLKKRGPPILPDP